MLRPLCIDSELSNSLSPLTLERSRDDQDEDEDKDKDKDVNENEQEEQFANIIDFEDWKESLRELIAIGPVQEKFTCFISSQPLLSCLFPPKYQYNPHILSPSGRDCLSLISVDYNIVHYLNRACSHLNVKLLEEFDGIPLLRYMLLVFDINQNVFNSMFWNCSKNLWKDKNRTLRKKQWIKLLECFSNHPSYTISNSVQLSFLKKLIQFRKYKFIHPIRDRVFNMSHGQISQVFINDFYSKKDTFLEHETFDKSYYIHHYKLWAPDFSSVIGSALLTEHLYTFRFVLSLIWPHGDAQKRETGLRINSLIEQVAEKFKWNRKTKNTFLKVSSKYRINSYENYNRTDFVY